MTGTTAAPYAAGPSLLVPAGPDTLPPDSEPAPFLVPGRPVRVDSTRTREARARTYFTLAQELEKRGELTTALAAYNSALVLDTTLTGVAFRMGRIYQRLGDPAGAARAFAFEMKRDPKNVEAAIERELQQQLFQSEDAKEGLSAYVEKRKPSFSAK